MSKTWAQVAASNSSDSTQTFINDAKLALPSTIPVEARISTLDKDILPLFEKIRWTDLDAYEALKPALRLAPMFLTHRSRADFSLAMRFGIRIKEETADGLTLTRILFDVAWAMRLAKSNPNLRILPIFFWKPDLSYGYFCQWYLVPITLERLTFNCAEQYMMYHKAKTFNDTATMAAILATDKPVNQKGLGRQVTNFDAATWDKVKFDVVLRVNLAKFRTCMARDGDEFLYGGRRWEEGLEKVTLRTLMLATGDRLLAEASKFDRVWGIGFAPEVAADRSRKEWGENLLGKVMMEVRKQLREEEDRAVAEDDVMGEGI